MELDYRARFHEEANPEKLLSDDGRTKTIPWEGHSKGRGGGVKLNATLLVFQV